MANITNLKGTTWRFGDDFSNIEMGSSIFNVTGNVEVTIVGFDRRFTGEFVEIALGYDVTNDGTAYVPKSGYVAIKGQFDVYVGETISNTTSYASLFLGNSFDVTTILTITGGADISNPLFIDFINTYGTLVSGGEEEKPTAESVKTKLQSLLTASNAKTGKSDANLTDAVNTLLEGYGSGEGIFAEEENEHGTTVVLGADLQEKTIDITANGTVEVTPDEGYALKKVTAKVDVKGVDKIQRLIELKGNKADFLFYQGAFASVDELMDGVDTSKVTTMASMFASCPNLISAPLFDTSKVTNMSNVFSGCSSLTTAPLFDTSKVTTMAGMFARTSSSAFTSVPLFDTSNVTSMSSMFEYSKIVTVPSFDMRNVTNMTNMFSYNSKLTECWIRNIKANLQVGSGTSYGHLLTLESLLHLCKECRKTTSSLKLTVGTANLTKLEGIYVKLIDITDDMRAEDDLIDEKYPFVQCESTDEGAMTIQDYMATKKWSLA